MGFLADSYITREQSTPSNKGLIMNTRHWIIYLFVWIAYFATLFCTASCKTRTLTQDHYITDQSVSKILDQSWQERFISAFEQMSKQRSLEHESSIIETTHTKDSTSTTVDQSGKPIKTESWHSVVSSRDTKEVLRLQDSVRLLNITVDKMQAIQTKSDSLIRLKQDSIFVLSRELTKAEKRQKYTEIVIRIIVLAFIVGIIIWRWHRKK